MTKIPLAPALIALLAASAAAAAPPQAAAPSDESIIVQGQRKAVSEVIRERFSQSRSQLARFEEKICPMVIGMPVDWTAKLMRMIRENIVAVGGKLDKPGCTVNATVIFSDQPHQFIQAFAKKEPGYFAISPREFDYFTAVPRPVVSWHVTEIRSRDGQVLSTSRELRQRNQLDLGGEKVTVTTNAPMSAYVNRQAAASRLYTNIREEMLVAFIVIDRQLTPGKTLGQLADLTTMHLLLDVKQDAGAKDPTSILSLFEPRPAGAAPPMTMSPFDRGIISGFYGLDENNRTAAQQYSQIAAAVRRGAGKAQ